MPGVHSIVGPSALDRVVRCPGSVRLSKDIPDESSSEEAMEGTAFHALAALCLRSGIEPDRFTGRGVRVEGRFLQWTAEMAKDMEDGLRYLNGFIGSPGWQHRIEHRVDISAITAEGQFGTSDFYAWNVEKGEILVFDWKYGHIPVSPIENYQLYGYLLGAWYSGMYQDFRSANIDPKKIRVTMVIEQPRVTGRGGQFQTNMEAALLVGDKIKKQAQLALGLQQHDLDRNPSEYLIPGRKQCMWCVASGICKGRANMLLKVFDQTPGVKEKHPAPISKERRTQILKMKPLLSKWLQELHAQAYAELMAGMKVPGLKLVMGRSPARKWKKENAKLMQETEATLIELLVASENEALSEEDAWKPKQLISPTEAEKLLGKTAYAERLEHLVDKGSAKPELVGDEDPRKPVSSALEQFGNAGKINTGVFKKPQYDSKNQNHKTYTRSVL